MIYSKSGEKKVSLQKKKILDQIVPFRSSKLIYSKPRGKRVGKSWGRNLEYIVVNNVWEMKTRNNIGNRIVS